MKGWLLDTNVVSELRRPRPNTAVVTFIASQPVELLFLSDMTLAEIRFGIDRLDDASRRADLTLWLDRTLRPLFAGRTATIGEDALYRWKLLNAAGQKRGHTFSQPDLFIAAMAVVEDLVVVSHDVSEFVAAGVAVFDPWTGTLHAGGRAIRYDDAAVTIETVTADARNRR